MSALPSSDGLGPVSIVAGLRRWAAGFAADEAAVELLVAISRIVPSVLDPFPGWCPSWLGSCPRPGVWFLDGMALGEAAEGFPAWSRPMIMTAAALATDGAMVDLGVTLAGTPSEWLGPVFAALAHAAGCRGLRLVAADDDQPGLFPWLDPSSRSWAVTSTPARAALTLGGAA